MKNLAMLLVLIACITGCDDWKSNPLDRIHTVIVINNAACSMVVILDGMEAIELPAAGSSGRFEDVSEGEHWCVAYLNDGTIPPPVIEELWLIVTERKDYIWTITNCNPV